MNLEVVTEVQGVQVFEHGVLTAGALLFRLLPALDQSHESGVDAIVLLNVFPCPKL